MLWDLFRLAKMKMIECKEASRPSARNSKASYMDRKSELASYPDQSNYC
jgi:hypothetical protein